MKSQDIQRRWVFCLLLLAISRVTVALTDAELKTILTATIDKHLEAKDKSLVTYAKPPAIIDAATTGCFIDLGTPSGATLDYKINFWTPQESSWVASSNVDPNEQDQDFDIQHYVKAFLKSCRSILKNEQLTAELGEVVKSTTEKLGVKFTAGAAPGEFIILLVENANPKSNDAIHVKLDSAKMTVTFRTNFFENMFGLSLRHQMFFNNEVEQAITRIVKDLRRMNRLIANAADKGTTNTVTCESFMQTEFATKEANDRVALAGWSAGVEGTNLKLTGDNQEFVFSCTPGTLDDKVAITKWTLTIGAITLMSQTFLVTSMYDVSAMIEMFLDEGVSTALQFGAANNPERAVVGDSRSTSREKTSEEGSSQEQEQPPAEEPQERRKRSLRLDDGDQKRSARVSEAEGKSVRVKSRKLA